MKNLFVSFSIIAVVIAFASCKKKDSNPGPVTTASVMFVNGCAGTNNINVTDNGNAIATNLALLFLPAQAPL